MLTLKDLENRVYSGKVCMRFECFLVSDDVQFTAKFERRKPKDSNEWNMQIILDRDRDKDSEVYNFGYVMPRENLPLELIAATGLRYFQLHIKEEIQRKSIMDLMIGEVIQGM